MMDGCGFYIVTGKVARGTVTYRCPTPEWALKKLRDFLSAGRSDITVTAPDGRFITEPDLIRLIATEPNALGAFRVPETAAANI